MPSGRRNVAKSGATKGSFVLDDRPIGGVDAAAHTMVPKHIPLPDIPCYGELMFELHYVLFVTLVLCCQYLNLYNTVWWLPHSHTDEALNYYLVDVYVMIFCMIIMVRRFPLAFLKKILWFCMPSSLYSNSVMICVVVVVLGISVGLLYCAYNICQHYGPVSIFCLVYPAIIYIIMFGFTLFPFLELSPSPKTKDGTVKGLVKSTNLIVSHACSVSPADIRSEVDMLKSDFNNRLKQVLYNSLIAAYYSSFVPSYFVQNYLFVDMNWVVQHGMFAWFSSLTLHTVFCFTPQYLDVLHRSALHLGRWHKLEARNVHSPHHIWTENCLWPRNTLVKYGREYFKAEGICVAAEPGNSMHDKFFTVFHSLMGLVNSLLFLQLILIGTQMYFLVRSTYWNHMITMGIYIALNALTLFKLFRQCLVMGKIYQTEQLLQERFNG